MIRFARWLRAHYDFPIRVPVYLLPGRHVVTREGERVAASFFAPWDRTEEPYIRVATGDYPEWRRRYGRDNALSSYLGSLAHEIIHYQQWVARDVMWERGVARKATAMVDSYAKTTDRP